MPTAAKLVAALLFAMLAALVAWMTLPHAPHLRDPVRVPLGCALLGIIIGWSMLGRRAGTGPGGGLAWGLTTGIVLALASVLLWSGWRMLEWAFRKRYDGPVDAVDGLLVLSFEHAALLLHPPILATLVLGAALAGLATERAARFWP